MQPRSLNEWLEARDRTLSASADVVTPELMRKTLKKVVSSRGADKQTHSYGEFASSRALYLEGSMAVQAYILRPDPEEGDWYIKISKSMTKDFVQNLGLVKGDMESLIGHRFACLFSQHTGNDMPNLKRISLVTSDNVEFLDQSVSDLTGPLRPWVFGIDLSSIKENVWF